MNSFDKINIGDSASLSKTISDSDIHLFSSITGDFNPIHIDENFVRSTVFGKRIAQGMLTAGLISAILGTRLPGQGTVYLSQTLHFKSPVYIGDTITARVEVLEKIIGKKQIRLKTQCFNQDGVTVLNGEALVMMLEREEEAG